MNRWFRIGLVLGAAMFGGSRADANQFVFCASGPVNYYVLDGRGAPLSILLYLYHVSGWGGIWFADGSGPHHRQVEEVGAKDALLHGVCEDERPSFEGRYGILGYAPLGGELWAVTDWTGTRIGTLFRDSPSSGTSAVSGGIGVQDFYQCPAETPKAVINDAGMFHGGLDRKGIDGVDENLKQVEYFNRIEGLLRAVAREHMSARGCSLISRSEFYVLSGGGTSFRIHYDTVDPPYIAYGEPN